MAGSLSPAFAFGIHDERRSMGQRQWGVVASITLRTGSAFGRAAAAGLSASLLALAQPVLAQGQERGASEVRAERRVTVSIPAQPLLGALRAFGLQTQSQVLFSDDVPVEGQRSAAVHGFYDPREALEQMLASTGVVITAVRPGSFTLRADAPVARGGVSADMRSVALRP